MYNTALTPGPGDSASRRPFPHIIACLLRQELGPIQHITPSSSSSSAGIRPASRIWSAYTLSESNDHCSGWFNEDGCNPQDPNKFNDNWGPSAFNMPHVFTTSWVYEIPTGAGGTFQTGNKVLDHILGPWQFNGILQFASGQNYHVGVSGDLANTGNAGSNNINGGYLRANVVGDPELVQRNSRRLAE